MGSLVEIISKEELEKLHTKVLLKRRKKLLECEEAIEWPEGRHQENLEKPENAGIIEYKQTQLWEKAYSELKEILSKRENILGSTECKKKRMQKAKRDKSSEKRAGKNIYSRKR